MEKEHVRVLTPFQCDGTKKHFFFEQNNFLNKILIIFNLNDKIMEKEPVRVLTNTTTTFLMQWTQKQNKTKQNKQTKQKTSKQTN